MFSPGSPGLTASLPWTPCPYHQSAMRTWQGEWLGRLAFGPPESKGTIPRWQPYEMEAAPRSVSASERSFPPRTVAPTTMPALTRTMFLIMY